MDSDLEQFDGILMTVLQKGSGINNFFDSIFGFLNRKTDFYVEPKGAFSFVETNYKKWLKKFQDQAEKEAKKKQKKIEEERARTKPTEASSASVKEITPDEYERRKKEEREGLNVPTEEVTTNEKVLPTTIEAPTIPTVTKENKEEKEEDKIAEGKVRPSKEGGGKTDKYTWAQHDIKEITITIPVGSNTRGKDLIIKPEAKSLYVGIKGQPPIISGELFALMKPDTFVWVLEEVKDGKVINITFEKYDTYKWWECVIKGDPCIDTTKIQPEPSKISDIEDKEMKAAVEKMMFDTRQKAMGLPTSDVLQKNPMIEDFIRNHPEMDFSKAKFG